MILKTNLLKPSPKRLVIIDMSDKQNQKETDFGFQRVAEDDKARQVREVFDSVAPKYDLMNDVLSFGMHRLWKCYAIHKADIDRGMKVLDLASGTADLSLKFAKLVGKDGEVWPTDINRSMLSLGAQRMRQAGFDMPVVQCDCEELPFPDNPNLRSKDRKRTKREFRLSQTSSSVRFAPTFSSSRKPRPPRRPAPERVRPIPRRTLRTRKKRRFFYREYFRPKRRRLNGFARRRKFCRPILERCTERR